MKSIGEAKGTKTSDWLITTITTFIHVGMCMSLCIIQPSTRIENCTISKQCVVVGHEGGQVEVMDMRHGQCSLFETEISAEKMPGNAFHMFRRSDSYLSSCVVLSIETVCKGSRIICGTSEQVIIGAELNWDVPTFTRVSEIHRCKFGGISSISVRPDERIFATTGWDRR